MEGLDFEPSVIATPEEVAKGVMDAARVRTRDAIGRVGLRLVGTPVAIIGMAPLLALLGVRKVAQAFINPNPLR